MPRLQNSANQHGEGADTSQGTGNGSMWTVIGVLAACVVVITAVAAFLVRGILVNGIKSVINYGFTAFLF